jgi:hypothetical protein
MNTQKDDIEEEKQEIEEMQETKSEEIVEVDEAAESAEGLKSRGDTLGEDTSTDRENTEDAALDIPESDIIR